MVKNSLTKWEESSAQAALHVEFNSKQLINKRKVTENLLNISITKDIFFNLTNLSSR